MRIIMKKETLVIIFVLSVLVCAEGKKTSRSRSSGSGRGTSKKTSQPQPAPTSFSYPQPAPKPAQKSLSTWQLKTQNGQGHSYPSSQTGLSGGNSNNRPTNQESIQKTHTSQSQSHYGVPSQTNTQNGHAYPSSNSGLSGSGPARPASPAAGYPQGSSLSGSGQARPASPAVGYPQGSGLSGSGPANVASSGIGYNQGGGYPASGSAHPHNTGIQGSGYSGAAPPPYPGNKPYNTGNTPQNYGNNYHHPQPPPSYQNYGSSYGGYGGHGYNPGPQMPGYFGNYGNYGKGFGGVSRTSSALKGVGIAGVGVGTLLTGLALWNLARSTGHHHHTVIYDNRGQPVAVAPANDTAPPTDSFLNDLVNCSLTISTDNSTEVLAIPCAIASSFSPDADVKDVGSGDSKSDTTKCIVSVLTKTGKEYMTTIPCATLLNTAAENNVTEPPLVANETENVNGTLGSGVNENATYSNQPSALSLSSDNSHANSSNLNCTSEQGQVRDPINPCFAVTSELTVIPLQSTDKPSEN